MDTDIEQKMSEEKEVESIGSGDDEDSDVKLQERRKKIAAASRLSRARKKEEIEHLKNENKRLKTERAEFKSTLESLEKTIEQNLDQLNASHEELQENAALKREIEAHRKMMNFFLKVFGGYPSEKAARQKLYTEGSENAHSYMLSMLSQSQAEWEPAVFKTQLIDPSVLIHYKISDKFFGESESSGKRFNMRFDCTLPAPASVVAECLRMMFSDDKMLRRIWMIKDEDNIELKKIEEDVPDGVEMLHQKKKTLNKEVVFISNKKKCLLPKSSLALPVKSSSKQKEADSVESGFGDVEAWSVTTTSGSMRTGAVTPHVSDEAAKVSSVILQGAIIWEECKDSNMTTRVTFINSSPADWILFDYFPKIDNLITEDGNMSDQFATWTMHVFKAFQAVMMETMLKGLKMPNFG